MKRLLTAILVVGVMFMAVPATPSYAAAIAYQESVIDRVGDWFSVIGKEGAEKDRVLAERKATRLAKHAEKQAKKAGAEAKKAGADMKKKMGL